MTDSLSESRWPHTQVQFQKVVLRGAPVLFAGLADRGIVCSAWMDPSLLAEKQTSFLLEKSTLKASPL